MKVALLFCFLFVGFHSFSQADTAAKEDREEGLIKYFSKLDLDVFKGQIVDSFLQRITPDYKKMEVSVSKNMFYGGLLKVYYPKNIYAHVFIEEFKRVNPMGICKKRNLRLAKKEVIAAIQIHNDVACIQGCN